MQAGSLDTCAVSARVRTTSVCSIAQFFIQRRDAILFGCGRAVPFKSVTRDYNIRVT